MASYKSIKYPERKHKFHAIQAYAAPKYVTFFSLLMLVILYAMSRHSSLLHIGIWGTLIAVFLAQFSGVVAMKRSIVEIVFVDDHYAIRTAYDVIFDKLCPMAHISLSNARKEGEKLTISYNHRIINIERKDWVDFDEILYNLTD